MAESENSQDTGSSTACYVYGLVPSDVELEPDAAGLGDPPAEVKLVTHRDIAALVSEVDVGQAFGRPDDLVAHEQLLDATVTEVPVLPLRFGAVMTDAKAVEEELLAQHHDDFRTALEALQGRAQYVVRARFAEEAVLREVLSESPEAAELREQMQGKPEDATRDLRMQLGELISQAVEAKRDGATRQLVEVLGPAADQHLVREPTHERDAAHVAFLLPIDEEADFAKAVDEIADRWQGRVDLRLLGPLAPYDFVGQARNGE